MLERRNGEVEYSYNFEASQLKRILKEKKEEDVAIVLRGCNGKFFIEEYIGKTMYPSVYKVLCDAIGYEATEEEYQCWLKLSNSISRV